MLLKYQYFHRIINFLHKLSLNTSTLDEFLKKNESFLYLAFFKLMKDLTSFFQRIIPNTQKIWRLERKQWSQEILFTKAWLEPFQKSIKEPFAKKNADLNLLAIFAECSIIDAWEGPKYVTASL